MNWFFLIPLTIGLVTGLAFRNADEDIFYLTGVISIISLAISLILAPWELQLLILMIIVVNTGKFWFKPKQSESIAVETLDLNGEMLPPQTDKVEQQSIAKYRGATYEHHTTDLEVTEVEVMVKYRGTPTTVHTYLSNKKNDSDAKLKYRGIPVNNEPSQEQS